MRFASKPMLFIVTRTNIGFWLLTKMPSFYSLPKDVSISNFLPMKLLKGSLFNQIFANAQEKLTCSLKDPSSYMEIMHEFCYNLDYMHFSFCFQMLISL